MNDIARNRIGPTVKQILALCLLFVTVFSWGQSAEQSVRPNVNRAYLEPEMQVERWVNRFEVESREIYASRLAITDAVGIEPGMAVADIGAGTGLFLKLFANAVGPTGQLYAVDIVPKFAERLRTRAADQSLKQVTVVLSQERSATLPANSIDIAFICDVYHHFEYPQTMLESIHRALRPGGTLVVIDFERIPGTTSQGIMNHVRAGKEVVTEEILAANFTLAEHPAVEGLSDNYVLRFRKH